MLDTDSTIQFYADLNGNPLQGGKVYFGVAGQNPVTSPLTIYWDAAGTQPVAQPVAVKNGRTTRNGNAACVYIPSDYSKLVQDVLGRQVSFDSSLAAPLRSVLSLPSGAAQVGYTPPGTGGVAGTVQGELRRGVYNAQAYVAAHSEAVDYGAVVNQLLANNGRRVVEFMGDSLRYSFPTSINTATNSLSRITFRGDNLDVSKLLQAGVPIVNLTEKNFNVNKNFYLNFFSLKFEGVETSGQPLVVLGTSDFNKFSDCQFTGAGAGAIVFNGSIAFSSRMEDTWFFGNRGWAIDLSARAISDVRMRGCRVEGGNAPTPYYGGIRINNTPNGNNSVPSQYNDSPVTIENGQFERLDGPSVYVQQGAGVVIRNNRIARKSVILSYRTNGCAVECNTFVDQGTTIIDGGYNNRIVGNLQGRGGGAPNIPSDGGFSTLLSGATGRNIDGLGGWTASLAANVKRVKNAHGAAPQVNSLRIDTSQNATRAHAVAAATFYVVRAAYNGVGSTTGSVNGGGKIRVLSGTPAVLLDTGSLIDADLQSGGQTAYNSFGFKTDASVTVTHELSSVNNDTIYFHTYDCALNACQSNPTFDDTWAGPTSPHANTTATGNMTVSQVAGRIGGSAARIQCPALVTATSEFKIGALTVTAGKTYECTFWVKDQVPTDGFSQVLAGYGIIGDENLGAGRSVEYSEGLEGWVKVTFQFFCETSTTKQVVLARRAPTTYVRAMDMLFDDFHVVEITPT